MEALIPNAFGEFLQFFRDFQKLEEGVFGFSLDPSYPVILANLRSSFEPLKATFSISEAPKLHIIFTHLETFLDEMQRPLGEYSEQALEACHSKFNTVWQRYAVKSISSANYGNRYLSAVLDFNSSNI